MIDSQQKRSIIIKTLNDIRFIQAHFERILIKKKNHERQVHRISKHSLI